MLRHHKDAEDVTQEVFVQIYTSLPQYQSKGLKAWMSRIAVNKAIDHKRKLQRRKENLTESMEDVLIARAAEDAEHPLMHQEKQATIQKMLESMPSNYRGVVQAFYLEEKSHKQIAAEQGVAEKTVASRLYRARKWVQKNWQKEDFE